MHKGHYNNLFQPMNKFHTNSRLSIALLTLFLIGLSLNSTAQIIAPKKGAKLGDNTTLYAPWHGSQRTGVFQYQRGVYVMETDNRLMISVAHNVYGPKFGPMFDMTLTAFKHFGLNYATAIHPLLTYYKEGEYNKTRRFGQQNFEIFYYHNDTMTSYYSVRAGAARGYENNQEGMNYVELPSWFVFNSTMLYTEGRYSPKIYLRGRQKFLLFGLGYNRFYTSFNRGSNATSNRPLGILNYINLRANVNLLKYKGFILQVSGTGSYVWGDKNNVKSITNYLSGGVSYEFDYRK